MPQPCDCRRTRDDEERICDGTCNTPMPLIPASGVRGPWSPTGKTCHAEDMWGRLILQEQVVRWERLKHGGWYEVAKWRNARWS